MKVLTVFAGPNGSGKTTEYKSLKFQNIFGTYLNADDLEVEIKSVGFIYFKDYYFLLIIFYFF